MADVITIMNGGVVYDRRAEKDNRKLNDVNKGMKEYAKYKLIVGILVVTIIIVLFFVQHNT